MKTIRLFVTFVTIAIIGSCYSQSSSQNAGNARDPLNLWNEGAAKVSIRTFIKTVTDQNNAHFIPAKDRMVVFDMDGRK
jgi:hypothetical protein